MDLKESLKGKLTKKELESLKTSFDVIGDVAIIEIPDELKKKEKDMNTG
jgi:tRNA (guanine37-N1)-methyltransferase